MIAYFDLETTGLDVTEDRIIEIAILVYDGDDLVRQYHSRINPMKAIPKAVSKLTGITSDMLTDVGTFEDHADSIRECIEGNDLCGYNSLRFDWPLLRNEFKRALNDVPQIGTVIDALTILGWKEKRDLGWAAKFYRIQYEEQKRHSALVDADLARQVFQKQLRRYNMRSTNWAMYMEKAMAPFVDVNRKFRREDDGDIYLAFGKEKGKSIRQLMQSKEGVGYIRWMLGEFEDDEVAIITAEGKRIKAEAE